MKWTNFLNCEIVKEAEKNTFLIQQVFVPLFVVTIQVLQVHISVIQTDYDYHLFTMKHNLSVLLN
jgi:hypothetical protein